MPHLHRDLSIVDVNLARQEIGADGCFIAGAKLLVDLEIWVLALAISDGRGW